MPTQALNMGPKECALLQQRRTAIRQLRRLAIELTDIDRQLDGFEQSERQGTPSDITEGVGK